jgi:zinc/manganese transport system substrate-binding protein
MTGKRRAQHLAALWGIIGGLLLVVRAALAADPIEVVASLSDLGKVAEAVGGDRVHVTTIAQGVQDPHFVDPKPSYMVKLRDAELLLVNGLDLEMGWVPPLIEGARNGKLRVGGAGYVDCSKNIPLIEIPPPNTTRADGDVHPFGNPHYTTDPLNFKLIAETVAEALSRLRPEEAEGFARRKKAFQAGIDRALFGAELVELVGGSKLDRLARSGELASFLDSEIGGIKLKDKLGGWLGKLAPLRGASIVFYHRSYSYFAQRFGLNVASYIELKPGIQPGPSHLTDVIEQVRRDKIGIVAAHPFNNEKIGRLVANKGGARFVVLPLNVGGVPGTSDVTAFFDFVTSALARAATK